MEPDCECEGEVMKHQEVCDGTINAARITDMGHEVSRKSHDNWLKEDKQDVWLTSEE